MLRCGLRVSEVAKPKLGNIDWEEKSLMIEQGKGRKDCVVNLSADAMAGIKARLQLRTASVHDDPLFWNQMQTGRSPSTKGIQEGRTIRRDCRHQGELPFAAPYGSRAATFDWRT